MPEDQVEFKEIKDDPALPTVYETVVLLKAQIATLKETATKTEADLADSVHMLAQLSRIMVDIQARVIRLENIVLDLCRRMDIVDPPKVEPAPPPPPPPKPKDPSEGLYA